MSNILFIAALSSATANQKTPLKNDEDDMHAFARNFMAAYNQSDIETIRKMYSEYAVRMDENGKEMTGSDVIADYFTHEFQSKKTTLLLKQTGLTWSDADRAWVARGTYEVYGRTIVYDIEIQRKGAYANTMIKDKDQWKIAKSVLTPLPPSENLVVVDGLYQAFAKGDIPGALAPMDPDIVWNEAESFPYADNNPYIGPDAVLNGVFARIGAEWEYWNLADIQLHDMANDMVLATLRYKAKHKATGKEIDSQTAHLWTLKYGKITAFQQFTDTKQAAEAVK